MSHELHILLVEDNPADVLLVEEAIGAAGCPARLSLVKDGPEALRFLRRQDEHAEVQRPDIIWLDLNLPGQGGHDVLREIRDSPATRALPVVVMTSSDSPTDVRRSYELHANSHVIKAADFDSYVRVIQAMLDYWGRRVQLPR